MYPQGRDQKIPFEVSMLGNVGEPTAKPFGGLSYELEDLCYRGSRLVALDSAG